MGSVDGAKKLLIKHNQAHLSQFKLNNDVSLLLPVISTIPWISASQRQDHFEKIIYPSSERHIKFISKNHQPHAFLWQTTSQKIKDAARWGVVETHSITGKVIGALGQYRVNAYKRISKGMSSNTQQTKLALLDIYQDRFEALQVLESCVNRNLSDFLYENAFQDYIQNLEAVQDNLRKHEDDLNLDESTITSILQTIEADIERTKAYVETLKARDLFTSSRHARGSLSVLEFVKQQMIEGLYELQGINQDLTYSRKRSFALTRGELNDYIEDARKIIDDHQADLLNAVTDKHHGLYSADRADLISYDFSEDNLTPERERDILLAVSFIEGWDELSTKNGIPIVRNSSGEEEIDIITATRWQTHRHISARLKSFGHYILNSLKGMFVATHPFEEETWKNPDFHLFAKTLQQHTKPNEPLWQKPIRFLKYIFCEMLDVFTGIRDFGLSLVIRMPAVMHNDWESSHEFPELDAVLKEATEAVESIQDVEALRLNEILALSARTAVPISTTDTSQLAGVEYTLTAGEQNDALTAIAKGLNGFSSLFLHTIYAKDPVGGLLFSAGYGIGVGAIYLPEYTTSILGAQYVKRFSDFSYAMSSSKFGAAIAGGSSQAQVASMAWDALIDGPSSRATDILYEFGRDPLTYSAYYAAAYGLGYVLTNGIGGHEIPWLSEHLRADLGTSPDTGYPFIGAKISILSGESLEEEHAKLALLTKAFAPQDDILHVSSIIQGDHQEQLARFRLITWLSIHAESLPRLDRAIQHAISRQIDHYFSRKESRSLQELLYPETTHSIAFQFLSLPLSYIPSILRVALSLVISFAAYLNGNAFPAKPIQSSCIALLEKTEKDLSRLVLFVTHALYLPYIFVSSMTKSIASLAIMAIGRVASIFDFQLSLMLYRGFSRIHLFCRTWTEFFFPFSLLRAVEVAHPNHTLKELKTSYAIFLKQLEETNLNSEGESVNMRHSELDAVVETGHPRFFNAGQASENQDVPDDALVCASRC
jgi:hypothetical protein